MGCSRTQQGATAQGTNGYSSALEGARGYSRVRGNTRRYSRVLAVLDVPRRPSRSHRRAFHLMRVRRLHADTHREERAVRQHHVEDLRPRAADGSQSFPKFPKVSQSSQRLAARRRSARRLIGMARHTPAQTRPTSAPGRPGPAAPPLGRRLRPGYTLRRLPTREIRSHMHAHCGAGGRAPLARRPASAERAPPPPSRPHLRRQRASAACARPTPSASAGRESRRRCGRGRPSVPAQMWASAEETETDP